MMQRLTNRWMPDATVVTSQPAINARAAEAESNVRPGLLVAAKKRAVALLPYVAGGLVLLAVVKLAYEKWIVDDPNELRGIRIGLYNFVVVGVMAMVFALGAQAVAGAAAHVEQQVKAPG